jgi:hypothetical protein
LTEEVKEHYEKSPSGQNQNGIRQHYYFTTTLLRKICRIFVLKCNLFILELLKCYMKPVETK